MSMASPEYRHINPSPLVTSPEPIPTLDEIERQLEVVDEIENVIERTQKREQLLELLDTFLSEE
jgi:hypothetical protein